MSRYRSGQPHTISIPSTTTASDGQNVLLSDVAMVELDMDRVCRLLLASERSLALVNRRALAATLANVPPTPGQVLPPAPPFAEAVAIAREDGQLIERTRLFLATHPRAIEELTPELTRTLVRIFDPTGRTARLIRSRSPLLSFFVSGAAVIGALTLLVSTSLLVQHVIVGFAHGRATHHVVAHHRSPNHTARIALKAPLTAATSAAPAAEAAHLGTVAKLATVSTALAQSTVVNSAAGVTAAHDIDAPQPGADLTRSTAAPKAAATAPATVGIKSPPPSVKAPVAAPPHAQPATAAAHADKAKPVQDIFAVTPIAPNGSLHGAGTAQAATTLPAPATTNGAPQSAATPAILSSVAKSAGGSIFSTREDAARQFILAQVASTSPGADVEWVRITRVSSTILQSRSMIRTGAGETVTDYTLQDNGSAFSVISSSIEK